MSDELKTTIEALGKTVEDFRAQHTAELKEIKEKDHADPLLAANVEKLNTQIGEISALKTSLEALETKVATGEFSGGGVSEGDKIKAQHAKAFEAYFRKGGESQLAAVRDLQIQAGLSTLSDPDGGYIVAPAEFDKAIDRVAGTVSIMRNLATVRQIGTNEYKKIVNKGGSTSGWVAEKETRAETNTPVLSEIAINMKEIYAMPGCTQLSLDDSYMDLASWLADEVSIEFAEEEGAAFVTGDGVAKPRGIAGYTMVANASYEWGKVGYVAGGHASLLNKADSLIDIQHALKSVYRNGASFLCNDATSAVIRKFKDGDGNYLWRAGLIAGQPDTLLGKPIVYDDNIADIGANSYPLFFGNFKRAYLILDRMGIRVLRDPYTSKGNVLFYTTKRVGGGITMFEALKGLKIAAS